MKSKIHEESSDILGGATLLKAMGRRTVVPEGKQPLYSRSRPAAGEQPLTAVPYCLWNNRGDGEMMVWIRES